MDLNVSIGAAALAGALSFLSPCVLPLVPSYLVFISGTSLEDLRGADAKLNTTYVLLAALMFVLGFTTVFVALGATASYFGQAVRAQLPLLPEQELVAVAAGPTPMRATNAPDDDVG